MYVIRERKLYDVIEPETYQTIKTFSEHEKSKAEEFCNLANEVAQNEQKKYKKELEKVTKVTL